MSYDRRSQDKTVPCHQAGRSASSSWAAAFMTSPMTPYAAAQSDRSSGVQSAPEKYSSVASRLAPTAS